MTSSASTRTVTVVEESFTLILSREEVERFWFLSYTCEGGSDYPTDDARFHAQLEVAFPDVKTSALARFRPEETF